MSKFFNGKIDEPFTPFSNGTQAMIWQDNNCDRCVKAWHPDGEKGYPKEKTIQSYVRCGKYCKLQYWIDIGWIEGSIPLEIAKQIGLDENELLRDQCMFYSDNEDDGYKPPKRPKPDNTPDAQLTMPFYLEEIGITESEKLELIH
jgi:hypothetical protein